MMRLNRKGFTLVEIMIVVAIIALLAAIAIPNLLRARLNANEAAAQATLKSLASACETFAVANDGNYPTDFGELSTPDPPYFAYDVTATDKAGYDFDPDAGGWGVGGYTFTGNPRTPGTSGVAAYQISTGARLRRDLAGGTSWADF